MAVQSAQSFYATTNKYIKGEIDCIGRKNPSFAMLKEKGRIVKHQGGGDVVEWNLRVSLPDVEHTDPGTVRQRVQHNSLTRASMEWARYHCLSPITTKDQATNTGAERMSNLMKVKVKDVVDAVKQKVHNDFFVDGASLTNRMSGCNTWSSTSGVSNGIGTNNDTYAGIGTALGTLGGDAPTDGTWPAGSTLTPEYDAHTPLVISSTSTRFGAATATWAANCQNILSFAQAHSVRHDGAIDTLIMGPGYYESLSNSVRQLHTYDLSAGDATMQKYGLTGLSWGGMLCMNDYRCPASCAFGINWDVVELTHLFPELFPTPSEDAFFIDGTFNIGIDTYVQLKFTSLRSLVKIAELG